MLRKTLIQVAVAITTVMVFTAFISAQNANAPNQTNQTSKPSSSQISKNIPQNTNWQTTRSMMRKENQTKVGSYTMMENLWKKNRDLYNQWSLINEHYVSMMKITNPNELHAAMAKHQNMLNDYNQKLMSYQNEWQSYMAAIQPPSTAGKNVSTNSYTPRNMAAPITNPSTSRPGSPYRPEN